MNCIGVAKRYQVKQGAAWSALMVALSIAYPVIGSAQSANKTQETEEIVVTASRISREGFTAPTPTTVVGTEEFKARAAVNLTDILYDLPSSRPSTTPIGITGAGFNGINLRNLNANNNNRSLVLIDRHRTVAMNQYGGVDPSVVPTALVAQLETVTGGASAAWGSDAVAGVVNVVLKKRLQGFEGNIQFGESERGDTKAKSAALAWGTEFADGRGQVMVAGEYSKSYDPATYADRSWANQHTAFVTKTINGVTYTNVPMSGLQLVGATTGGVITNASLATNSSGAALYSATGVTTNAVFRPLAGLQFGAGGTLQPFTYTTDTSFTNGTYGVGGSGGWIADQSPITVPTERKNIYGRVTFDLTSQITAFADASHFTNHIATNTTPTTSGSGINAAAIQVTVSRNNPYLQAVTGLVPGTAQTLYQYMLANNIQNITLGRIDPELGIYRSETNQKVDRFTTGLDGVFGDSGKWSVYASHGKSVQNVRGYNNIIAANFQAALNGCQVADITNYGAAAGCVAGNPFGPGAFSDAFRQYVTGTLTQDITNKQNAGGASIQGEPFSSWAGPVSLAGGVEYRKESLSSIVDPIANRNPYTPGTFNYGLNVSGGFLQSNPKTTPLVSYIVREAFAETVVPLLKNLPAAKSLDLNAAVRSTDYSTSGRVTSWKGGLTYVPLEGVLLRGTRSHDIRAPSLAELYQGNNLTNASITGANGSVDYARPGDTTNYNFAAINAGNPKLTPEIAETTTFGVTWSPAQLKGFSASLDYYLIRLNNGIGQLNAQTNVIDGCYGRGTFAATGPVASFCNLIVRGPYDGFAGATVGRIQTVDVSNTNIGLRRTNGIDVDLSYRFPLASLLAGVPGTLTLRGLATYVISDKTIAVPVASSVAAEAVGTNAAPRIRATLSTTYQTGPYTANLQARYIDALRYSNTPATATTYLSNNIPSRIYLNASGQYTVYDKTDKGGTRLQLYGNINNLLDKDPPLVYGAGVNPSPTSNFGFYDVIGRAYVVGMRFAY